MKAYIRSANGESLEIDVKWRSVDSSGLVHIEDKCGLWYETHLSNVIFVGVK